jgi:site-specific recombinase XerD
MGGIDMNLHAAIERYITYRQNTGEKFQRESDILKMFCNWIGKDAHISAINENICVNFMLGIKHSITPVSDRKYTVLKGLFEWLIIRGLLSESPLPVERPKPLSSSRTYIYSTDELYRIFNGARKYLKNLRKNHVECFEVIFKLTYVLGLRINETLSLCIEDINLKEQFVIIKESKFYKTRLAPFNAEVKSLLESFMAWRKKKGMPLDSNANLFLTPQGLRMTYPNTLWAFKVILANEGITGRTDSEFGPRIHDLRASFAVHRLVKWYNQGEDVQLLLPYLSTYMGHDQLSHTSVYLSFTTPLLHEANKKFENYANKKRENE